MYIIKNIKNTINKEILSWIEKDWENLIGELKKEFCERTKLKNKPIQNKGHTKTKEQQIINLTSEIEKRANILRLKKI